MQEFCIKKLGGKAANLYKIINVSKPKFFVLDVDFFEALPNENDKRIAVIKEKIKGHIKTNKKYAIRSSAIGEDGEKHSFAGIMESYLNIEVAGIPKAVLDCYLSAFSDKAVSYRKINNIPHDKIKSAVIIQEMIDADYAGVIFTINPVSNNPHETLISVVKGLGDNLVSGKQNSHDFIIDAKGIDPKNSDFISNKLLNKLHNLAIIVQSQCNKFQDIEFAIKNGKIYFLQTRDITPYRNFDLSLPQTILDNSNIIESFCGLIKPLTFSFAKDMYENVYTEALKQAGVKKTLLNRLKPYLENLIVYKSHRIYYNLNSWYKIVSVYPNAKTSARRMERLMGFNTGIKNERLKLGIVGTIKFVCRFLNMIRNIEKSSVKFLDDFYKEVYPFSIYDFNGHSKKELVDIFCDIEKKTIPWYVVPVINDQGAMAAYQKLTKIIDETNIDDKEGFISSLFINLGQIESALSAEMFSDIVKIIKADEGIKNDFDKLGTKELFDKYHSDSVLSEGIKAYINKFGARVCDELKFETITMIQDPLLLYDLLKVQIQNEFSRTSSKKKEIVIPNLPKRQKKKFLVLTKKTAYFIRNRERLRLTRTHTFSAIRNLLLRLSDLFFDDGMLKDKQDIFYLTKQEVFALANGEHIASLQEIVKKRKAEYEMDIDIKLPDRMVFIGDERLDVLSGSSGGGKGLTGIPSGAGKITGKVKLILDPKNACLNGEIILAKRTDPGWITLFPMCSGLIVEYGSVLSHSAVVAREMGIPAVVGLKGATSLIKDGAMVTLDAIKGEVVVHE